MCHLLVNFGYCKIILRWAVAKRRKLTPPKIFFGGVKGERAIELVLKFILDEESDNREMTAFFREVALHAEVGGEVIDRGERENLFGPVECVAVLTVSLIGSDVDVCELLCADEGRGFDVHVTVRVTGVESLLDLSGDLFKLFDCHKMKILVIIECGLL